MDDSLSAQESKIERAKAKELRKSRWWQSKLSQGTCYYCLKPFPPLALTMDHVIPLARGGRSTKGNLVACCKPCNTAKRHSTPWEWSPNQEGPTQN